MGQLGIYAVNPDVEEVKEEVAEYFPMLKDYVEKAAARGEGLLVWMM